MRLSIRVLVAPILVAIWPLLVPVMNAQAQSSAPDVSVPTPSVPDQKLDIPERKLDAAAAAMQRLASLEQDYRQKMERIADEANAAVTKAVTDQGLSVEEYTSIIEAAQNDPEMREKIRQRIQSSAK